MKALSRPAVILAVGFQKQEAPRRAKLLESTLFRRLELGVKKTRFSKVQGEGNLAGMYLQNKKEMNKIPSASLRALPVKIRKGVRGAGRSRVSPRGCRGRDRRAVGGGLQALNEEPQPQVRLALGLLNLNPLPCSVST